MRRALPRRCPKPEPSLPDSRASFPAPVPKCPDRRYLQPCRSCACLFHLRFGIAGDLHQRRRRMSGELRRVQQVARSTILVLIEEGGTNRSEESTPGAKHIVDRGRLIAAADHAVSAFWIAGSCSVVLPPFL